MTLLTKKVADEVGKTVDHVNQVDEVSAHSNEVDLRCTKSDRLQQVIRGIFSYNFGQKF